MVWQVVCQCIPARMPSTHSISRNPLILLASIAICGCLPSLAAQVQTTGLVNSYPSLGEIVNRMIQAEGENRERLDQYSVTRKYQLRNGTNRRAEMEVRVDYRRGEGKSFEVLSSEGEGVGGHVLRRLLETEAELSRQGDYRPSRLSPENYSFRLLGTETRGHRLCYVLELTPLRKSKYLLAGKAWVDAKEFAIVHVEGQSAASVSFWVGKPFIVLDFEKVGNFWLASHNFSHADCKLIGSTDLTIEYSPYQVQSFGERAEVRRHPRHSRAAYNSSE